MTAASVTAENSRMSVPVSGICAIAGSPAPSVDAGDALSLEKQSDKTKHSYASEKNAVPETVGRRFSQPIIHEERNFFNLKIIIKEQPAHFIAHLIKKTVQRGVRMSKI